MDDSGDSSRCNPVGDKCHNKQDKCPCGQDNCNCKEQTIVCTTPHTKCDDITAITADISTSSSLIQNILITGDLIWQTLNPFSTPTNTFEDFGLLDPLIGPSFGVGRPYAFSADGHWFGHQTIPELQPTFAKPYQYEQVLIRNFSNPLNDVAQFVIPLSLAGTATGIIPGELLQMAMNLDATLVAVLYTSGIFIWTAIEQADCNPSPLKPVVDFFNNTCFPNVLPTTSNFYGNSVNGTQLTNLSSASVFNGVAPAFFKLFTFMQFIPLSVVLAPFARFIGQVFVVSQDGSTIVLGANNLLYVFARRRSKKRQVYTLKDKFFTLQYLDAHNHEASSSSDSSSDCGKKFKNTCPSTTSNRAIALRTKANRQYLTNEVDINGFGPPAAADATFGFNVDTSADGRVIIVCSSEMQTFFDLVGKTFVFNRENFQYYGPLRRRFPGMQRTPVIVPGEAPAFTIVISGDGKTIVLSSPNATSTTAIFTNMPSTSNKASKAGALIVQVNDINEWFRRSNYVTEATAESNFRISSFLNSHGLGGAISGANVNSATVSYDGQTVALPNGTVLLVYTQRPGTLQWVFFNRYTYPYFINVLADTIANCRLNQPGNTISFMYLSANQPQMFVRQPVYVPKVLFDGPIPANKPF